MTFNINLYGIKKKLFLVPRLSGVTMETSLSGDTRDFLKLLFHMFPYNEILKFSKVKSELIFGKSTPKYLSIPNFSEVSQRVWELRASEI